MASSGYIARYDGPSTANWAKTRGVGGADPPGPSALRRGGERRHHGAQRGEEEERERHARGGEEGAALVPSEVGEHQVEVSHAATARSISVPFSRCSTALADSAAWASWVTITIVFLNSSLSRRSSASTSCELFASSCPVGSSRRISVGSATNARAIATRCS